MDALFYDFCDSSTSEKNMLKPIAIIIRVL